MDTRVAVDLEAMFMIDDPDAYLPLELPNVADAEQPASDDAAAAQHLVCQEACAVYETALETSGDTNFAEAAFLAALENASGYASFSGSSAAVHAPPDEKRAAGSAKPADSHCIAAAEPAVTSSPSQAITARKGAPASHAGSANIQLILGTADARQTLLADRAALEGLDGGAEVFSVRT